MCDNILLDRIQRIVEVKQDLDYRYEGMVKYAVRKKSSRLRYEEIIRNLQTRLNKVTSSPKYKKMQVMVKQDTPCFSKSGYCTKYSKLDWIKKLDRVDKSLSSAHMFLSQKL